MNSCCDAVYLQTILSSRLSKHSSPLVSASSLLKTQMNELSSGITANNSSYVL